MSRKFLFCLKQDFQDDVVGAIDVFIQSCLFKLTSRHTACIISSINLDFEQDSPISTHSDALLTDAGIDGREVLVLEPVREGTTVRPASDIESVRALLEAGLTVGEVVPERAGAFRFLTV